jgi:hypothetical protein
LPDALGFLRHLQGLARRCVVVSEPVRNLTASAGPLRSLAGALVDPGSGPAPQRFDADALRRLSDAAGGSAPAPVACGREQIFVLPGGALEDPGGIW